MGNKCHWLSSPGNGASSRKDARNSTEGQDDPNLHVGVVHAEAKEDCDELVRRVKGVRPSASLDIVTTLGPVIGTHGGPGTLGLFWFWDSLARSQPR